MRKSLAISAVAHTVALLWGLITFNATPFERTIPESVPIEFVSANEFAKITAGTKDAPPKVSTPKQKAEKVAEKKPVEDTSDKITEKQEIVTSSTTEPPPTPDTKKPDPKAKPVQQAEAKPEKAEKVEQKVDPIAEALKKDEKKQKDSEQKQAEAKATPLPPKRPAPQLPKFDASKIQTALLDKRDPRRQAIAGDVINDSSSFGAATANAVELSQDEIGAFRARMQRLWSPPASFADSGIRITIKIRLGRDRRLIGQPEVVSTSGRGAMFEAARDAAFRALRQGEPFDMLRPQTFDAWNEMEVVFDPSLMLGG